MSMQCHCYMTSTARVRTAAIWAISVLVSSTFLSAQRYTFRQYGVAEGLTNLTVGCLLQDRTGYLWAGTDNGLFRYDGTTFQSFMHRDGLPATDIRSLAESPDGVLWVATGDGVARRTGRVFQPVGTGEKGPVQVVAFDRSGRI